MTLSRPLIDILKSLNHLVTLQMVFSVVPHNYVSKIMGYGEICAGKLPKTNSVPVLTKFKIFYKIWGKLNIGKFSQISQQSKI